MNILRGHIREWGVLLYVLAAYVVASSLDFQTVGVH